MRALPVLLLCSLSFVGCPATDSHDGADGPAPADDPPADRMTFESEADVHLAFAALELPYLGPYSVASPPGTTSETCPVLTGTGAGTWTGEGGCTNSFGVRFEGRYTGRTETLADGERHTLEFESFRVISEQSTTTMDGRVVALMKASDCGYPGPAPLEADGFSLTLSGNAVEAFGGWFPGEGRTVRLIWREYTLAWDLRCDASRIEVRGEVEVEGRGTFTFDALQQKLDPERCTARDQATGQTVFIGSNVATVTRDGDVACDDCLPYEIEGGSRGELCWP